MYMFVQGLKKSIMSEKDLENYKNTEKHQGLATSSARNLPYWKGK